MYLQVFYLLTDAQDSGPLITLESPVSTPMMQCVRHCKGLYAKAYLVPFSPYIRAEDLRTSYGMPSGGTICSVSP